jgi:hypothetical protein
MAQLALFWSIMLPLIKPAQAAVTVFEFQANLWLWLLMPALASTQQATPEIELEVADPDNCAVAPRSVEELEALLSAADASTSPVVPLETPNTTAATPTPFVAPVGPPGLEEVGAPIAETVTEFYACGNANDQLRQFALMTDSFVVRNIREGQLEPATVAQRGTVIAPKRVSEFLAIDVNGIIHEPRAGEPAVNSRRARAKVL